MGWTCFYSCTAIGRYAEYPSDLFRYESRLVEAAFSYVAPVHRRWYYDVYIAVGTVSSEPVCKSAAESIGGIAADTVFQQENSWLYIVIVFKSSREAVSSFNAEISFIPYGFVSAAGAETVKSSYKLSA